MADLFEEYRLGPGWDEMFSELGVPRPSYEALYATLQSLSSADLAVRSEVLARAFLDQGITFALKGVERPFPLDIVPRLITALEWSKVQTGVSQRIRTLEMFLADVYGPAHVLNDGVVPRRVVVTSAHFHREAAGVNPPNGVRIHVAGVDLIRDEAGEFRVLEDNVRIPSGVSYVIENRRAIGHVLPEVLAATRIRPVESYPAQLLHALRASAPAGVTDPTVVVLTPGVHNSAYFEHTLLAREMGVELVEGRDLFCSGNEVWMRTTAGERRVDVIYRRIDDEFLDPVHFRADSVIGVAGLLNAARAGHVTISNAVGNGVADDKLLYTYVPDLIRYYLNEEPVLSNVPAYRLDDGPEMLEFAFERMDSLVFKPVDGSGGSGIVIGSRTGEQELEALKARISADPRGWIAQQEVALSMVPTLIGNRLRGRHVDLRPFAVNDGERVWVLPGGLTRVALPEGELVVNSSQGGGSKDTWVLASAHDEPSGKDGPVGQRALPQPRKPDPGPGCRRGCRATATATAIEVVMLSRIAESLYWIGRYIERAEGTARILDVHVHGMLADPWIDQEIACHSLLTVMGVATADQHVSTVRVVGLLGLDQSSPSSVVGALAAARENARGARETISTEMWECLNATWLGLPAARLRIEQQGMHAFFGWVRERCSLMAGLTEATMSHDDGWLFLMLGRSLERADMTARLLSTHVDAGGSIQSWLTLLRSCGAWETFLRTYRGALDDRHAAEFLLLDRLFPRSVFAALSAAESCLADLEPVGSPGQASRAGVATEAQRIIGRARTDLEFRGLDDLLASLSTVLSTVERSCSQVNSAVSSRYFRATSAIAWAPRIFV